MEYISGGTRMTVSGENLNSVAYPVVHARVTIVRPDLNNPANPPNTTMAKDTPEVNEFIIDYVCKVITLTDNWIVSGSILCSLVLEHALCEPVQTAAPVFGIMTVAINMPNVIDVV